MKFDTSVTCGCWTFKGSRSLGDTFPPASVATRLPQLSLFSPHRIMVSNLKTTQLSKWFGLGKIGITLSPLDH